MTAQRVGPDRLREALRGNDPEISQAEALDLIAASPFPQREVVLASVLQDPGETTAVRSAVADTLGRIPTRDSELVLLANLRVAQWRVRAAILRALGGIGGREELVAIEDLHLSERDREQGMAAFAGALIAHRLGLPGHELPVPAEEQLPRVPDEQARPIEISLLRAELAGKVLEDVARQPYGIEYDRARLVRLACNRRVNVVCPNRVLLEAGGLERLRERKALAGVVALESPETGDYSVSYVIMIAPAGSTSRVQIVAPRCSGRPGLAGTGVVTHNRLEFTLRSVERPGTFPILLSGEASVDGIAFHHAIASREQLPSREPDLLPRPRV